MNFADAVQDRTPPRARTRQLRSRAACCVLASAAALGFFAACRSEDPPERAPTPVRVQAAGTQSSGTGVRYSATINPYAQLTLEFKVSGYVREIFKLRGSDGRMRDLQAGDRVAAGEVLAHVDDSAYIDRLTEAGAELARARASLRKAEQDWKRASNLFETQSITAPEFDSARKEFESARASVAGASAAVAEAELNLGYCSLTAPMKGVLLQRSIEVGSLVRPGSAAFELADLSSVKVVFGVPDVALAKLELESPLDITTESIRNTVFEGRITGIAPAANTQNRVFEVEVTVPNQHRRLRAGMIAALDVGRAALPESTPVVPMTAVIRSLTNPNGYAVVTLEEENETPIARVRDVELGEVYGNQVAVLRGLSPGERVIVTGATLARDGTPVRVIP